MIPKKKKSGKPKDSAATYPEDYTGNKKFYVSHPKHARAVRVSAPTEAAAIVAASVAWREDWTQIDFYCDVTVTKC